MYVNIYDESYSQDVVTSDRKLVTSASVFGILRQQLAKNIGIKRIKGFLFHYGWEMGVKAAKEALQTETSLEYLIKHGPILHIENGHIKGIKHECNYELDGQGRIKSFFSFGTWFGSYEAEEHIKRLGHSNHSVCHTLIGYASGFMSTIFGETLLAKEITCVGKGDDGCGWVIKPKRDWETELDADEVQEFYNETPIVMELEYTYDQILDPKIVVTRLSKFQNKLTEEIINGSDLQTIADIVFYMVNIPMIIEDSVLRTITYSGLSEESYMEFKAEMEVYMEESRINHKQLFPISKKIIKTANHERLITPILLQKEIIGYCTFVYKDIKDHHEEDYLFLDRLANAASLILLNEKTKFESFEKMKGNFLEQILESRLPASEIVKRGKYIGLDLEQNYYISVMKYKNTKTTIEDEFLLQEQIFETTYRYFNDRNTNLLVGHRDGQMVLLISNQSLKHTSIHDVIKEYHVYMTKKYPYGNFKFGISHLGADIHQAAKCYSLILEK